MEPSQISKSKHPLMQIQGGYEAIQEIKLRNY